MVRMNRLLLAAAVLFTAAACTPKGPADPEVEAAKALAARVVGPQQARHFVFEKAEGEGDFFRLGREARRHRQ